MSRRQNTFRVDYSNVPKKPSFEDVHKFVGSALGLQRGEVKRIQCSRSLGCAFVKVDDLEVAQRIVDQHDKKHAVEIEGKPYPIRITLEDGAIDVKLFDLSEDLTDKEIADFLNDFGEVLSIRELCWDDKFVFGGIPTGVRVAKMMVKRNIESYVTISGESTLVSYYGQQQTCRHCMEFVHNGVSCVQNKKLMVQKSYADAAKQPKPKPLQKPKNQIPRGAPGKSAPNSVHDQAIPSSSGTAGSLKTLMPPPPNPQLIFAPYKPLPSGADGLYKTNEGNETDTSSTSNSSRRSRGRPSKKPRTQDEDIEKVVDIDL